MFLLTLYAFYRVNGFRKEFCLNATVCLNNDKCSTQLDPYFAVDILKHCHY